MTFNEANVNRKEDGKFGEKTGTDPEFELKLPPGPWEPRLGETVFHVYVDRDGEEKTRIAQLIAETDGNHTLRYNDGEIIGGVEGDELYPNPAADSSADIAKFETFESGRQAVNKVAFEASDDEIDKFLGVFDDINEGAWGDIRKDAVREHLHIRELQAIDVAAGGRDASDMEEVDKFYALLTDSNESTYGGHVRKMVSNPDHDEDDTDGPEMRRARAISIMGSAAEAAHYRDFIGNPVAPKWTQEAYDHVTRPYREVFGPLHPADELQPESWKKRPLSK